jgi:tetratricopeptide (TPR) repeat protein
MLSDDFLMRRLRIAVAALARFLGLETNESPSLQLDILAEGLEGLTGLPIDLLDGLDDDAILSMTRFEDEVDTDMLSMLAQLHAHRGNVYEAMGNVSMSVPNHLRALTFALESELNEGSLTHPLPEDLVDDLLDALDDVDLSPEMLYALFQYDEQMGNYAGALDALEELDAHLAFREAVEAERIAFLTRLRELRDEELAAGGVTREELV